MSPDEIDRAAARIIRQAYNSLGDARALVDEIRRLRQGLWDIYAICGGDTDGDPTPTARVSDILPSIIECARELREDYDNERADV